MSEWQNPLFTKVIRKSKLGCIITMNRFNVGPNLCVNKSTKGKKKKLLTSDFDFNKYTQVKRE